jgi:hypothetical protein
MSDDTVNTASAAKAEELKAEANALFSGTLCETILVSVPAENGQRLIHLQQSTMRKLSRNIPLP